MQKILRAIDNYKELGEYINHNNIQKVMLVCGDSFKHLNISNYIDNLANKIIISRFSDFQPNPKYDSVIKGVKNFREARCEAIIAIGGGSAMDMAKCIKLCLLSEQNCKDDGDLKQPVIKDDIKLIAIPTTAGSGSEATRFAVIYNNDEKQSVTSDLILPDAVLFDPSVLNSLSFYQKKCTMLDALCHSVESYWSVNSTDESRGYSEQSIRLILKYGNSYLGNDNKFNAIMQNTAYMAGKAINITQTTAGHAMCYKLTSLYGISHGHAAALCVKELWPWMIENMEKCIEPRGQEYLKEMFCSLAEIFDAKNIMDGAITFKRLVEDLKLGIPCVTKDDYRILCSSVNSVRLKNNPVKLDAESINLLYKRIFM